MGLLDDVGGGINARARPPLRGPVAPIAAAIYGAAISWRNHRFDRGKGVVTFDRPVISVGNLSVGGTGKTPMVLHLARVLAGAGHKPCVAMRGYGVGADSRGGSDGLEADEAKEYRRAMRTLPIVARPDRTLGLIELFGTEHGSEVDCVILDDGFQHRQVGRQFDIVLIDATRSPFEDRLLPAGWLREPVESLRRAQAAVLTHAEAVPKAAAVEIETRLWDYLSDGVVAAARHEWAGLMVAGEFGDEERPVDWLGGKRVFVACAIGNPAAFLAQARAAGDVVGKLIRRDHAEYGGEVVEGLMESLKRERADVLLVTEKDWSKLMAVGGWPCPVARPRLEMRFERGGEELERRVVGCVERFEDEP